MNLRALHSALEILRTRDPGVPGLGLCWGGVGLGKTTALSWLSNQPSINGLYVRAMRMWSPSAMLGVLMRELGAAQLGRCAPMIDFIADALRKNGRCLLIDECDYCAYDGRLIDTLRDICDVSGAPMLFVGTDSFRRKITVRDQLAGRISQWIEFQPASLKDARTVSDDLCEVRIEEDLLADLHHAARGSMRGLVVGLSRIEHFAKVRGLVSVDRSRWGGQPFVLTTEPSPAPMPKLKVA
ncbi:MAG: AAA family ATPase [Candidatus Binataceae bacterium]